VEERAGGNAAGDPSTNYWRLPTGTCCHQPQQPTRSLRPDAMSRAEQAGGLPDELQSAVNARYEGLGHNAAGIGPLTLDIADEMGSMPHDPREILKAAIAKDAQDEADRVDPLACPRLPLYREASGVERKHELREDWSPRRGEASKAARERES